MPVAIHVDASGLRDLRGRFRKAADAMPGELRQGLQAILKDVRDTARREAPKRTGALARSIGYTTRQTGPNSVSGTVQATAKHAVFVAEGTRPHLIVPRRARFLRFVVGGRVVYARVVRHPGTRANPFLKRAAAQADLSTRAHKIAQQMIAHL